MKKSLIALAVASALTVPMIAQADATLYGVAQYRGIAADNTSFENQMAKTRLGVKGTVDNDIEGLTTGYQFEWEFAGNQQGSPSSSSSTDFTVDVSASPSTITVTDTVANDVNMRKSLVYVKGGFGQLTMGTQNNPGNAEGKTDIMGRQSGQYAQMPDRISQAVAYYTPSMGGFIASAAFTADGAADGTATDDNVDVSIFGLNWSGAGVGLAAGVADIKDTGTISNVGVSYSGVENLYVAVSYSKSDEDDVLVDDVKVMDIAAAYSMGKTTLTALHTTQDDGSADDASMTGVGVAYALGASAAIGVDYYDFNAEDGSNDEIVLQYTVSF
ncbi:MAG: putative porin [Motiliproteus sp.]|jgi:predicted porin